MSLVVLPTTPAGKYRHELSPWLPAAPTKIRPMAWRSLSMLESELVIPLTPMLICGGVSMPEWVW